MVEAIGAEVMGIRDRRTLLRREHCSGCEALRVLGAARKAGYFATAPFIGALASVAMFRELPE